MTLLEVLVALAVFLLSVVGLSTLMRVSSDRAAEVREQSWAIQRCQSKLAEVVAGAVPLSAQSDVAFDEDPDWQWTLDVQDPGITGLMRVSVRVSRTRPDGKLFQASLTQMVLDPAIKGGSAPAPTADAAGTTNGSTSGGRQ